MSKEYEIAKTQFPGPKKNNTDVVIGLDFGTSCTKVVLRTPYLYSNRAFAVPFTDLTSSKNPYLLPSKLWLQPDGKFSLREKIENQSFSGIKLNLLEKKEDDQAKLAAAYLALVIRFAREWFLSAKQEIYGDYKLRWHTNLGLPSSEYDTSDLFQLYKRILRAAWILSLQDEGIRNTDPSIVFDRLTESRLNNNTLDDVQLEPIPEVAAAMSGYARSPLRDPGMPGLHLLVDIGAGTLDVCGFVLHQQERDNCYTLLKTDVQLLGVIKLHENRLSVLEKTWDHYNPDFSIPSDLKDYLERLRIADKKFSKQCQRSIKETVHCLRTKKDLYSPCWQNSLPVFICGGGLNVPFYIKMVLREIDIWLRNWLCNEGNEGLKINTLPRPENLVLDLSNDYHRLAVAWGLSIPAADIGRIDQTKRSPDMPRRSPSSPDYESRFISKDMV